MATKATAQPTIVSRHLFTFPPFPQPPQGVHVVPFVDFNERGISTNPGPDEIEVDSLGVPTTMMRTKHETDFCKTKTKRKKPAEKKPLQKANQLQWWEAWEETEVIRFTKNVDPRSSRQDKLQAAITDFTKDRTWPPQVKRETGPRYIWEKFLRFIGLPEGYLPITELSQSKKKKRQAQEDDSMSDDSDDEDIDLPEAPILGQPDGQNPALVTRNRVLTDEDRLQVFLEDPAKVISVFMTSHSWNKGYIWSEDNLFHMPRLLDFLIRFLLRSKVFPDLEHQYRLALEITKEGLVQLPNSAAFMKAVPDKLATGCTGSWGRKAVTYKFVDIAVDNSTAMVAAAESGDQSKTETTNGGGSADNGGWGGGGDNSNWSNADPDADAMGAWSPDQLEQLAWKSEEKQQPMLSILGPTAFPLTHTAGVVERSMRCVKSIRPPNNIPPMTQGRPEGGPDPTAVEIDLDCCFTKILLAPMPDWDNGEAPVYSSPTIMESSRGAVVGDGVPDTPGKASGLKPHDPNNDDIIVLMESQHAKLLREGMGVAGTWVQIVRQNAQVTKRKGKGKAKKPPVYWYLEEVAFITASFWSFFG